MNLTAFWEVVKGIHDLDPAAKFAVALVAAKCWDEKTTAAKLSTPDFVQALSLSEAAAKHAVERAVKNGCLRVEKRDQSGTTYRLLGLTREPGGAHQQAKGAHQRNGGGSPVSREKTIKTVKDKGAATETTNGRRRRPVDKSDPRQLTEADLLAGLASMTQPQAFDAARSKLARLSAEHRRAKGKTQ